MASEVQVFGPFTEAQGEVTCLLEANVYRRWHEITVTIYDAGGVPGQPATGTLSGAVKKAGADQVEDFDSTLDLAANQRAWAPELSTAEIFYFTISGLNVGYTYEIMINSWRV